MIFLNKFIFIGKLVVIFIILFSTFAVTPHNIKMVSAAAYGCTATPATVAIGQNVTFSPSGGDNALGWSWLANDGPMYVGPVWVRSFSTSGLKTVLVSNSSTGDSFTQSCSVTVLPGSLTCSPATQTVDLYTNASLTASGGTSPYSWSASGGSPSSGSGSSFDTSYSSTGTKSITLTDSAGGSTGCNVVVSSGSGTTDDITCRLSSGWPSDGPCAIASGSSTTIDWTSSGYASCFVSDQGGFSPPPLWNGTSGSQSTGALTASKSYYLYCEDINLGTTMVVDTVTVAINSADLKISSTSGGPYSDGPLTLSAYGTVYLSATCGVAGGSGRISPGNTNFNGTSYTGTGNFAVNPKTWTLTCYPSANQTGTPTATDFVTAQLSTPDFTFVCNTLSKTVTAGSSTVYDTTVTAQNGFNSSVTVSITSGLPAGASHTPVTLTPASSPGSVASVPVTTSSSTPVGTYNLTFDATGGGKSHTCTSQLVVTNGTPTLISLDVTPSSSNILVGATQVYAASAQYSDGSSAVVTSSTTFSSSDTAIASLQSAPSTFIGNIDGTVTITGQYTEGLITVVDTASLEVGNKAAGGLSASLTCPSGTDTCNVSYNTSINLTWTSTGADECSVVPDLTPSVAKAISGTASTGNLTNPSNLFTLDCVDSDKNHVTDVVTVTVTQPTESFINADKDVTAINGSAISNTSCNGGTDSVTTAFKSNDLVSFKINLCNSGTQDASGLTLTDTLTNLAKPTAGWNAKYNGSPITPTESGTSPNQILTFTIPGTIAQGSTRSLTFDAVVNPPSPATNTIYRFQNIADISNANGDWRAATPLYIFYAGSKVPSKQEVAP